MRRTTSYFLASFLLVGAILASALLFQWHNEGAIDPLSMARVAFLLLGVGILLRVALGPGRAERAPLLCPQCGSRVFETRATVSPIPLLTCFGCGLEVQMRVPERARRAERRPPAPGAA